MERAAKHASIKAGFNAGVLRREFLDTVWWVNEDGLNLGDHLRYEMFRN